MSLINTPPRNRIPIQTEIAQFDLQLIREVIMKELHRGGQVYFVHDRVQNIDLIRAMLEEHIPKARFHVAHGQMKGHELENAMMAFLEKKFDVLLCTKIIESGIDIPSVNTIIINRADRFGLAELYQLRGRVGRSNVNIAPPAGDSGIHGAWIRIQSRNAGFGDTRSRKFAWRRTDRIYIRNGIRNVPESGGRSCCRVEAGRIS